MDSADFGKITHILMTSNLDAIKMLKILYRIQKLNTDIDWDSDEEPKIVFSEEETTRVDQGAFEVEQAQQKPFKRKGLGEF